MVRVRLDSEKYNDKDSDNDSSQPYGSYQNYGNRTGYSRDRHTGQPNQNYARGDYSYSHSRGRGRNHHQHGSRGGIGNGSNRGEGRYNYDPDYDRSVTFRRNEPEVADRDRSVQISENQVRPRNERNDIYSRLRSGLNQLAQFYKRCSSPPRDNQHKQDCLRLFR